MPALNPDNGAELLERFCDFGDAVIRRVDFYPRGERPAQVWLDAADKDGAWHDVCFEVAGVQEFRLQKVNAATEIVFFANIRWYTNAAGHPLVFLSFDGPDPTSEASIDDFRQSAMYLAGSKCSYTLSQ